MKTLVFIIAMFSVFISHTQNGIIGDNFANGWGSPGGIVGFGDGISGTRILVRNPSAVGNQYFRLVRNWDNNFTEYGPFMCTDTEWTAGVNSEYENMPACGGGAFYINCPNTTDNYVFKTRSQFGNSFVYFRVQGPIRSVISVSTPVTVTTNQAYDVDVELYGALTEGQQVYLRYTSDAFTNSTVVAMTGSGTSYSAQIPGFSLGTNVIYYVFTSGDNPSVINHGNADLYTINLNNNGGPNYSYIVQAPLHVSILQFSAIDQASEVHLNASIDTEIPLMSVTFQKMSGEGIGKSGWKDIHSVFNHEINSRLDHTDTDLISGTYYYRLSIIDLDGLMYFSPVQMVTIQERTNIAIYPNPFRNELFVSGLDEWSESIIVVSDLLGRVIFESKLTSELSILDVSGINMGVYSIQVLNKSGQRIHQQLMVK